MNRVPRYVGIDLGTTYSAITYLDDTGHIVTVPNRHDQLITPSTVLLEKSGVFVVGQEAKRAAPLTPDRVVECVKRDMGQLKLDVRPIPELDLPPEVISALILRRLKMDFEQKVGAIQETVITVPARFTDTQRHATREAGEIAGLRVMGILNEPAAAALEFSFRESLAAAGAGQAHKSALRDALKSQTSLVFDLGGGTFDVTIVRSDGHRLDTLVTDGNDRLGGKDWDDRIVGHLVQRFIAEHGIDPRPDPMAMADLRAAAETAKESLSTLRSVSIPVQVNGKRLSSKFERQTFDELTADLLAQTEITTALIIEQKEMSWDRIDNIVLVGGATKMPMIPQMLQKVTGKTPTPSRSAELVVAEGAAIYAAILVAQRSTAHEALGPIQELPFDGEVLTTLHDTPVSHVNSHSLGVVARDRTGKKKNSILIPKNTPIPVSVAKVFGLASVGARSITATILEGESGDPKECAVVGNCTVSNLPAGLPRGSPVRIICRYDPDGRVHFEAKEMVSGFDAFVELYRPNGHSPDFVEKWSRWIEQQVIE